MAKRVPLRYVMMVVLCLGTMNLYSQRMCLSIAILCMTNNSAERMETGIVQNQNNSKCGGITVNRSQKIIDGPFNWDRTTVAHVLGMFFWGYLFAQIPSGIITQKLGARKVNLVGIILLGLSTGFIPLAAVSHVYLLYALRIISGLSSAFWFPGFYQVWASWAPPHERGLLVGLSYAGVHVGNAITLPIAGALCQTSIGWSLVFYFYGAACLLYALVWAIFVYDTPTEHPRISDNEKKFIFSQCGDSGQSNKKQSGIPIVAMLKSLPVWAFVVLVIGYDWNGYTMLTSIPIYMKEVLLFDINENAGLSALPYLGLWFGQLLAAWVSDKIISRKWLSVSVVRKLMTFIGMFGPALLMVIISLFDCRQKYVVVVLFTVGLMLNSGVFAGGMLSPIEMSPQHSGFIFAAGNTLGAVTGVLAPIVVSLLTPQKTYEEWRYVFYVGAGIYALCGLIFVCFSSSKQQPWATVSDEVRPEEELSFRHMTDDSPMPISTNRGDMRPLTASNKNNVTQQATNANGTGGDIAGENVTV